MQDSTDPEQNDSNNLSELKSNFSTGRAWLAIAGIGFIYGSIGVFATVCFKLYFYFPMPTDTYTMFLPFLILSGIGTFGAIVGIRLLKSVGVGSIEPNRVINQAEWNALCDEVKNGQDEAITQYIRLTSLSGFTGSFTKLGLSGLPLATIALTLFFTLLSIPYQNFSEMAKLTLGAFIGSFVQKQAPLAGSSVKLPTGEKLSVTSAPGL